MIKFIKKTEKIIIFSLIFTILFGVVSLANNSVNLISSANCSPNSSLTNGQCPSCYSDSATDCSIFNSNNNNASSCTENGSKCNIFSSYINPTINVLSALVVLVAIASIIIAGISYSTSGGDSQKVAKAKTRIINTLLALLAYIFLYSFLQFILPGGLLNK